MDIVDELKGVANLSLTTTRYNDRDEALNKLAVYRAAVKIERFERALRFAAGIISTYPPHVDQHPEEVYNWIIKESDYDNGD